MFLYIYIDTGMYNFLQIYPGCDTENVLKGPERGMKGYVFMFADFTY